jgi:hypothetical protein
MAVVGRIATAPSTAPVFGTRAAWQNVAARRGLGQPVFGTRAAWQKTAAQQGASAGGGMFGTKSAWRTVAAQRALTGSAPASRTHAGAGTTGAGRAGSAVPTYQGPVLDAAAAANIAQHTFNTNEQIAALNLANSRAFTNFAQAGANLDYNQPIAQNQAAETMARRGGLYSSAMLQAQENLARNYDLQRSGLQQNLGNTWQGNLGQISGLQAGIPIYNQGQAAMAAQRAAVQAAKNPVLGERANFPGARRVNVNRAVARAIARMGLGGRR